MARDDLKQRYVGSNGTEISGQANTAEDSNSVYSYLSSRVISSSEVGVVWGFASIFDHNTLEKTCFCWSQIVESLIKDFVIEKTTFHSLDLDLPHIFLLAHLSFI